MLTSTDLALLFGGRELTKELQGAGITMLKPVEFEPGRFKLATLSQIKHSGIRIVILMAFQNEVQDVASSAEKQDMITSGWAWITTEERETIPQLQGWLFLRPLLPSDGMQAFAQQVSDYTASRFNITLAADSVDLTYSAALHDAVMLYAYAATRVLAEGGDLHDGVVMTEAVRSTRFKGLGNRPVALNAQGDRIDTYEVMSIVQGADAAMESVPAGVYSNTEQQYRVYEQTVVWPGGTTVVPVDYVSGAFFFVASLAM